MLLKITRWHYGNPERSNGNVTLLGRPIRPIVLLTAAQAALRARRRQYAARAALERQRAEVRQRDEFLAMLGHEIRNPLSGISLAAVGRF